MHANHRPKHSQRKGKLLVYHRHQRRNNERESARIRQRPQHYMLSNPCHHRLHHASKKKTKFLYLKKLKTLIKPKFKCVPSDKPILPMKYYNEIIAPQTQIDEAEQIKNQKDLKFLSTYKTQLPFFNVHKKSIKMVSLKI